MERSDLLYTILALASQANLLVPLASTAFHSINMVSLIGQCSDFYMLMATPISLILYTDQVVALSSSCYRGNKT